MENKKDNDFKINEQSSKDIPILPYTSNNSLFNDNSIIWVILIFILLFSSNLNDKFKSFEEMQTLDIEKRLSKLEGQIDILKEINK